MWKWAPLKWWKAPLFIDAGIDLSVHGGFICVRIGAEISNWACRPRSDVYAWLHGMRTHRLQQWPSRFCCDPFVPFALSGHFRSELRLLYPETLKRTHQGLKLRRSLLGRNLRGVIAHSLAIFK
ncbi:hypothetical protein PIB30_060705 [Stylosanthes scabra]|uniref:Uncharacterized protein n=1 Tax=Stylosanthes scabra TaxID=79078 RepID=A0ABU6UMA3_9FABA|nr:hypothetical protein [Stylosanthes scabra]